jgi:hypothetical protein
MSKVGVATEGGSSLRLHPPSPRQLRCRTQLLFLTNFLKALTAQRVEQGCCEHRCGDQVLDQARSRLVSRVASVEQALGLSD